MDGLVLALASLLSAAVDVIVDAAGVDMAPGHVIEPDGTQVLQDGILGVYHGYLAEAHSNAVSALGEWNDDAPEVLVR